MSKMACKCGSVISDVEYPCDSEGYLVAQFDWENAYETISTKISDYVSAIENGKEADWLETEFGRGSPWSGTRPNIISDIIRNGLQSSEKSIAECTECGRLWVQVHPEENKYLSYAPDNGSYNKATMSPTKNNA